MSTDTTVVLVHGARLVRRTLPILVGLLTLAAPLVGQARHGHFYHINYYQVRPGQEKAYDSALVDVVTPVFDELVKRKAVVSCVFSPAPAILVSNKYDTTALRFTNSSNTGVTTLTSAESYAFSWPGRT